MRPLAPRVRTKSPAGGEPNPLWVSEFKGAWCFAHFPLSGFLSLPELVPEVAGGRARQVLKKTAWPLVYIECLLCTQLYLRVRLVRQQSGDDPTGTDLQPLDRQLLCFSVRLSTRLLNGARALVPRVWKSGH